MYRFCHLFKHTFLSSFMQSASNSLGNLSNEQLLFSPLNYKGACVCPAWRSGRTSPILYVLMESSLLGFEVEAACLLWEWKWMSQEAVSLCGCLASSFGVTSRKGPSLPPQSETHRMKGQTVSTAVPPELQTVFQLLGSGHCRESADRITDTQLPCWHRLPSRG